MKYIVLNLLILMAAVCGSITAHAQDMGVEFNSNGDGTYTLSWTGSGGLINSVTTNSSGYYDASNGSCSTCGTNLPPAVVIGYTNSGGNFMPSYYNVDGTFYGIPNNYPPTSSQSYLSMYMPMTPAPPDTYVPPLPTNPCNNATQGEGEDASNTLKSPVFASALATLKAGNTATADENGFAFGYSSSNGMPMTAPGAPIDNGSTFISPVNAGMNTYGTVHTHNDAGYSAPSVGDLYALAADNAQSSDLTVSFVYDANGQAYALMIVNPLATAAFVANYPSEVFSATDPSTVDNGGWSQGTGPAGNYAMAYEALNPDDAGGTVDDNANTYAMAYMLTQYDTGMVLCQLGPDGNFHQINCVPSTNATGPPSFSKFNCP